MYILNWHTMARSSYRRTQSSRWEKPPIELINTSVNYFSSFKIQIKQNAGHKPTPHWWCSSPLLIRPPLCNKNVAFKRSGLYWEVPPIKKETCHFHLPKSSVSRSFLVHNKKPCPSHLEKSSVSTSVLPQHKKPCPIHLLRSSVSTSVPPPPLIQGAVFY